MNALRELLATLGLEDNSGGVSSQRAVMYAIIGYMLFEKAWLLHATSQAQPWTQEQVFVLGVVLGAKALQRGREAPASGPTGPDAASPAVGSPTVRDGSRRDPDAPPAQPPRM